MRKKDYLKINTTLVQQLIAEQFPDWLHMPIAPSSNVGTSHCIYRLGTDMNIRLPRTKEAALQVDKEQTWLPRLAPELPLAIPQVIGKGQPANDYPCPWSIYHWIKGDTATTIDKLDNPSRVATMLGKFVNTLHSIDPREIALPGEHNFFRGLPLSARDEQTRQAIDSLRDSNIDVDLALSLWEKALATPIWDKKPVLIHGDLIPINLLVDQGKLNAVLDFGAMAAADPACDMLPAWTFLTKDTRDLFRQQLHIDDATWARGKGWGLTFGLVILVRYQVSNPALARIGRYALNEVLRD